MSKITEMLKRPATISLSSRVDMRHLATIAAFWNKAGETPRSISELVRLTIEGFAEVLVTSGQVEFFETQSSASEYLTYLGLSLNHQRKNIVEAMKREAPSLNFDSLQPAPVPSLTPSVGVFGVDNPDFLLAQKHMEEALKNGLGALPHAEDILSDEVPTSIFPQEVVPPIE